MLARWALASASLLLWSAAALADVSHALLEIHERIFLEQDGRNVLGNELIHQPAAVASLYEQSGFQPIWEDPAEIDQVLDHLPDEALDWSPGPEMNSVGILVTHLCGAERYWLGDGALGLTTGRERAEEFAVSGSRGARLKQLLQEADAFAREAVGQLTLNELETMRTPTGANREFSVAWCLMHALEHTSVHTGHIQQIAQLWELHRA